MDGWRDWASEWRDEVSGLAGDAPPEVSSAFGQRSAEPSSSNFAPGTSARLASRRRRRGGRPAEIYEATRWLFGLLALASVLTGLMSPLAGGDGTRSVVAAACAVVLWLSWSAGYLQRGTPIAMDLVDSVAILAFALACATPAQALGLPFAGLWFRSLYGSDRRAVLRCGLYSSALLAVIPLWPRVFGHVGSTEIGPIAGTLPTMFLTLAVARQLAASLRAGELAMRLDAVHAATGNELLDVNESDEVSRIAWSAIDRICSALPGVRVLHVSWDGSQLRVVGVAGDFVSVPAALPESILSVADGDRRDATVQSRVELNAATGALCAWTCLSLPGPQRMGGRGWLLIGSPGRVPEAAVNALSNLSNQLALAFRNCKVLRELTVQATLDGLTALANRASFNAALAEALDDGTKRDTAVLFVDLDKFKQVNDVYGHAVGDGLICEVAVRLLRATRPEDLCARIGGDEFAVLLRDTDRGSATEVAHRIVNAIEAPATVSGQVLHIGASVGVAIATTGGELEQLIHHADVAMYLAKTGGKARVQVYDAAGPGPSGQSPASSVRDGLHQLA
jgi:diguanylate cyclase (GGDEF)-like protein